MLCGSKTGRSRCSPDFQGVLRLQHHVCSPGGQKYLFKSTSTEQRLSTPTPWYCLVSDQNQDATEAHFWGHLGGSIILTPRHTTSLIDTDWTRPHSTTISEGQINPKLELASCHEEPVIVITQQAVMVTCHNDIWWCGCLFPPELASPMCMVSPDWQQASSDIAETTARIEDIARDLPAIHALSGCDTVVATYSIGELTAIKAVKRGKSLSLMGYVTAHLRLPTLHRKQQNSSQHIMLNMLRGALHLQNEGRKSRPTKLVEEQLRPPNFVHPTNISYVSWKCKMLPLSGVQMKIGIAPRQWVQLNWVGKQT